MYETIEWLIDNFINGNISDCKKKLQSLQPLQAAHVAVRVFDGLPNREQSSWLKVLENWGD